MDVALEDVNLLLSQLNLGASGVQLEDGAKFEKASSFVVEQVLTLERALARQHGLGDGQPGCQEPHKREARGLVDVAIERGMPRPPGGTDDSTARAEALGFMRSELQVLCIEAHRRRKQKQPLLAGLELTVAQRQTAERVNAAIAADFALRRRMLLRRCDVTVQSFLRDGGDAKRVQEGRAKGTEEETRGGGSGDGSGGGGGGGGGGGEAGEFANLPPTLRAKRQALSDKPRGITVDDALAAPVAVALQHSQRITTEGFGDGGGIGDHNPTKATKTSIKMAEIAEVSDRGGRVGDARSGPAWKSQKEFDKAAAAAAAGGRGGGGRGGSSGSGRSGKRGGRKGGGGGQGKKEGGGRRNGGGGSGGAEGHAGNEARGGGGGRGGSNKRKRGGRGDRAAR